MKKIISGIIMIALLLSMVACSSNVGEEATQGARQEIQLNEKITVGEKSFKLTKFEWKDELLVGKKWSAGNGNTFARIKVSFYNEGRKEMNIRINARMNFDNGYEITNFFGENGYFKTNYPIDMTLAAGRSYDLVFAAAEVTEFAKTDTGNPLWIEIEFEGEQYIYYIRK